MGVKDEFAIIGMCGWPLLVETRSVWVSRTNGVPLIAIFLDEEFGKRKTDFQG